ncbi:hypothetical protein [Streptomyces goshikiensis]
MPTAHATAAPDPAPRASYGREPAAAEGVEALDFMAHTFVRRGGP